MSINHTKVVTPWLNLSLFAIGYAAGPIILRFHSDDIIEPEQEIGFDITYRQLATGCIRVLK
jgi:hypothetical protein